jgi:phosphomannomutase
MVSKILFLFDIDGTLVESSKNISSEHGLILNQLKEKYEIGIVGGGVLNKNLEQFGEYIYFNHYLTECGCVYYKNELKNGLKLKEIYTKNIRHHELYLQINVLIKCCLGFLSNVSYTLSGHFVDLRNGLIYISLIGTNANDDERKYFMELDAHQYIRKDLLKILHKKVENLGIKDRITICEGGNVGIAIYPNEYDKAQVVNIFNNEYNNKKYDEIHYFGDKYEENGNDYNLINHECIIGHKINNYNETYEILKQYL